MPRMHAWHIQLPPLRREGFTMVMWGAICGGVLGLLWRGHDWEIHLLVGMVLGALAGRG